MFKKQKPADLPVPKIIKKPAPAPPVPPKESTELGTTLETDNLNDEEKSSNEDKDSSEKSKATIQEASKTTISTVQDENTQVTDSFVSVSFATGESLKPHQAWC